MKTVRLGEWLATGLVTGALVMGLAGCASKDATEGKAESSEPKVEQQQAEEVADTRLVLGEDTDGAVEVDITNGLDFEVTSWMLRASGEEAYGDELLSGSDVVAPSDEVRLFVSGDSETTYDIRVVGKAGEGSAEAREVEFVGVPLATMASATLKEADGVAYVDYVTADGASASTKDEALARKEQTEQSEGEEAQTTTGDTNVPAQDGGAAPVAEPVVEQVPEQTYVEPAPEQTYVEPAPAPEPVYTEPVTAPVQTEDVCLEPEFR